MRFVPEQQRPPHDGATRIVRRWHDSSHREVDDQAIKDQSVSPGGSCSTYIVVGLWREIASWDRGCAGVFVRAAHTKSDPHGTRAAKAVQR